jgi:hypothetical protein
LNTPGSPPADQSILANIFDSKGVKVGTIGSGGYGGAVSGPVVRTVFDSEVLPAFPLTDDTAAFIFAGERFPNETENYRYYIAVVPDMFTNEGDGASAVSFLRVGNGAATAHFYMDEGTFASPDEAKEWMQTENYKQIKTMFTSMRYV